MCGDGGCVAFIVVVCLLGGGSVWVVNSGVLYNMFAWMCLLW